MKPMNRSPRKILMTTDAIGGVWTFALQLCKAMPSVNFLLANMGPRPSLDKRCEVAGVENAQLIEGSFQLEWADDPWEDLEKAGRWLLELESKFQPDLVHLNGYVHASLPWRSPVIIAAHSCVMSWWKAVKGVAAPARWDRYAAAVADGLQSCDRVVAPSRTMGDSLVENYGIADPLIIPNGCELNGHGGMQTKEPFILCAARLWDEGKNVPTLAQAASDLAWPVVLAGDSDGDPVLYRNVCMVGHCNRASMTRWFRRASIYSHPSRYEPFGLAPLEAAYAGCALVLADIPSLREIWGDAAEFVDPTDSQAWRAVLENLISNPGLRSTLANRATERARRYSPSIMADAYLDVYQDLLKSPEPHLSNSL
jgi:glycogen synthase